ncbi:O-antigen ligase family protein [Arthrobacter citreus]|uniref:O-antigen ligase family protein n=1 Tax=Arthrobacter TaxID=1663 RepID=UPI0012655A97|nr:O-antigen ligase family protein [Arthrobacter gandavensis]
MNAWILKSAPYAIWLLLLGSTVAWRKGFYYDGGADGVVLAKAACQALACLLAFALAAYAPKRRKIPGRPFLLLFLFVSVSLLGAVAVGDVGASVVLAARLLLVAATVGFLLAASPTPAALKPLLVAMAIVGLVSAATGLPGLLSGQRLAGVIPPLRPNAIAMLCGVPAIALAHNLLRGKGTFVQVGLLGVLLGAVLATESRTALLGLALAAAMIGLALRRMRRAVAVGLLALGTVMLPALLYTPALMNMVMRPGSASLLTLNSRTLAWETVLDTSARTWERWVGGGLSIKTVAVKGQYWDSQVLDSSWISALAQAGVLGTLVLAMWAFSLLSRSLRRAPDSFLPAMLLFLLLRSFLENGLTEVSTSFLLFFAISLVVWEPRAGAAEAAPTRDYTVISRPPISVVPQLVKAPR